MVQEISGEMNMAKPILFYTSSAKHIAERMRIKKGRFVMKRFTDGEIYVRVLENVRRKTAWVLASTFSPAENLLELAFLLDALKRGGAIVNLIMPYFGYARQDRVVENGECLSSEVVCSLLRGFRLNKVLVIEMHSPRLKKFLKYENIVPFELFYPAACRADVVAAPDKGAVEVAKKISRACSVSFAGMEKIRPVKEKARVTMKADNVKGKRIMIIDDMISTGGTIIEAGKMLKKRGVKEVSVVATHGLFTGSAVKKLEKSPIKRIYVTNSIPQKATSRKIKVIDISGFVEGLIKKS